MLVSYGSVCGEAQLRETARGASLVLRSALEVLRAENYISRHPLGQNYVARKAERDSAHLLTRLPPAEENP